MFRPDDGNGLRGPQSLRDGSAHMFARFKFRLVAPDLQPGVFQNLLQFLGTLYILAGIGDENIRWLRHPPAPLLRHPKCASI